MQVTVTGRHLEMTDAIRQYARGKVGKLPRYYDRVSEAELIAEKNERLFRVELRVQADHHDPFIAHNEGDDLYACIDAVVDKLERQLTDHKEKVRNRKHQSP